MRAAADSSAWRSVLQVITPFKTTAPLSTHTPADAARGIDSPVSAEVSTSAVPDMTTASIGIRSPALTIISEPTSTFSASITFSTPLSRTVASSGRISISARIDLREWATARCSKYSPTRKNSITATPSDISPIIMAPTDAIDIRNFSSRRSRRSIPRIASQNTGTPATVSARTYMTIDTT